MESVGEQLGNNFDIPSISIIPVSAKSGENVITCISRIISDIPQYIELSLHVSPSGTSISPLRALLFDSKYDAHKGVLCHVLVVDGSIRKGLL